MKLTLQITKIRQKINFRQVKSTIVGTSLYNQNMGGVDFSDQVMYAIERKVKTWPKKVVFNLLTRLLMNSYII